MGDFAKTDYRMDANDLECDRFSLVSEKQAIQQTGSANEKKILRQANAFSWGFCCYTERA
jgi:hypothetical protein